MMLSVLLMVNVVMALTIFLPAIMACGGHHFSMPMDQPDRRLLWACLHLTLIFRSL